jgi:hypothetical protein
MEMIDFEKLAVFRLSVGSHETAESGLCAMEAVAWLEGLPHSDHPACTCPIFGVYVRVLSDTLPDDQRQRLLNYLPRLVGTVAPEKEWERAQFLIQESFSRVWPVVLRAWNLNELAQEFEQMARDWKCGAPVDFDALSICALRLNYRRLAASIVLPEAGLSSSVAVDLAAFAAGSCDAARVELTDRAALGAIFDIQFEMLDDVLKIGAPSPGFTKSIEPRILAYRELVS